MNTLLIIIAFALLGVASYRQGRRVGSMSMAITIAKVGERKFPDFKKTIALGMLDDLNEARKLAGKKPFPTKGIE